MRINEDEVDDNSYIQYFKKQCRKFLLSPHVLVVFKFALGAMAWQGVYNKKGVDVTQAAPEYALCCLLSGLADSAVSSVIDITSKLAVQTYPASRSVLTEAKQFTTSFISNAVISGLWQPSVDAGQSLGRLISPVGGNVLASVFVFTMNASLYHLLGRHDPTVPSGLTAGLAELSFFLCGPIALPGSPSGSRTVIYSGLFTFAGAFSAEVLLAAKTRWLPSPEHKAVLPLRDDLGDTSRCKPCLDFITTFNRNISHRGLLSESLITNEDADVPADSLMSLSASNVTAHRDNCCWKF